MSYIREIEGDSPIYPYALQRLPRDFPNVSFMQPYEANDLAQFGVFAVSSVTKPEHDRMTQRVAEIAPEKQGGAWVQRWQVVDLTDAEKAQAQAAIIKEYTDALTRHLDAVAQAKNYDNRITCAVRAGYAGPFQAEGQAFAAWMDTCNALGYQVMADVLAGNIPMPTAQGLIDMLPDMEWPQ